MLSFRPAQFGWHMDSTAVSKWQSQFPRNNKYPPLTAWNQLHLNPWTQYRQQYSLPGMGKNRKMSHCSRSLHHPKAHQVCLQPVLWFAHLCKHFLVLILQMQGVDIKVVFVDSEGITVFCNFWDKLLHFNCNVLTALLKRLYRNIRSCDTI